MKRVWPSRIRWYSSAIGSLTLRIRSPVAQTSSAVARICAPAADVVVVGDRGADAGAGLDEHLVTVRATSSCTPAGVIATRYSWFLTSRGMPTFTWITVLPATRAWGRLFPRGQKQVVNLCPLRRRGRARLPRRARRGIFCYRADLVPM